MSGINNFDNGSHLILSSFSSLSNSLTIFLRHSVYIYEPTTVQKIIK